MLIGDSAPGEFSESLSLADLADAGFNQIQAEPPYWTNKSLTPHRLSLTRALDGATPLALLLPIDSDLPARLVAASRLWRLLSSGLAEPPGTLTTQRRARLIDSLRALDGRHSGASIRQIAAGLFGANNLPSGRDWQVHDLRSRTRRLIDTGVSMMRGGYRALLRPAST